MHRVERLEMNHLVAFQGLIVFQAAQHGQVDGVLIVRARRQRGVEDDLIGRDAVHAERIAQRQLVLGQGAGLVRAQHVHARQFLDGRQPGHNRLFFGQQARADRHGHGQHRGHRHGNRGHRQHQGELKRGEHRVAAEERDGNNHRHQSHREDDQVIADLQHRALEMADGVRLLHQLRGLAEVGVRAGGVHHRVDFALADDRTRKHRLARFSRGGQRFARQRGLIHLHRVTLQQARIRRHDVAQAHADDVARHQLTRRRGDPLPITFHPGLDRQLGLQRGDGVARLVFFPESDHGVGQKQKEDDGKVRPMPGYRRKDHGHFDHPRDGTPKIGEEFQERIGFLFFNLVRPILGQPFLRLGLTEAVRRRPQFFLQFRHGKGFQIVLRIGLRSRLRFGSLGLVGIGFHNVSSLCLCYPQVS